MPVVFKTNADIFQQHIVTCVNALCALRQQLHDGEKPLDEGVKMALETSIIKISTRLDSLFDDLADGKPNPAWSLPKLDNQDIASAKFDQEFRMAEYALWAQEVQKQVALGNIQYTPSYTTTTVEAEPIPSPKPRRPRRKKTK